MARHFFLAPPPAVLLSSDSLRAAPWRPAPVPSNVQEEAAATDYFNIESSRFPNEQGNKPQLQKYKYG